MDFVYGMKCKDFAIVCCDAAAVTSILRIKQEEDKIVQISDRCIMGTSGEAGDRVQFTEFIMANIKLYSKLHRINLTPKAIANFTRTQLAQALRKSPYYCNLMIAGYDEEEGPQLYWMDYLATMQELSAGGHGYGALFANSVFDRYWRADLTPDEALGVMKQAIDQVKKRLVVAPPTYLVKIVDKDGVRELAKV